MISKRTVQILLMAGFIFLSLSSFSQPRAEAAKNVLYLSSSGYDNAHAVAFSPNGDYLMVGTNAGVLIFDGRTYSKLKFISTETWSRSVAFSPDGKRIAAGLFDHSARLWSVPEWAPLRRFDGHAQWVRTVAFSPDGQLLATCADDDTVRLWNTADGSLRLAVEKLPGVRVLAMSPDGQMLALGLKNGTIELRRVSDGSLVRTLTGHTAWVRSLAFSPDGSTLASGAFDATVRLWEVASGRLKYTLADHQSSVLGLAFSPDGRMLASGSVDTTVKLWDVREGSLLRTLIGHSDFVYSVAFSPDGRTLVSGAGDNTVRIWDMTATDTAGGGQPSTPGDCRACHHPIGHSAPPRVAQVGCDACHANGAGLNFCPTFPRDPQATSLPLAAAANSRVPGVPVGSDKIAVVISYPANGETLYTLGDYRSFLRVSGRVYYEGSVEDVHVELLAFSEGTDEPALTLTTQPAQNGQFAFKLALNPSGARPISIKLGGLGCTACHEEYQTQGGLPNGGIRLLVRAAAPEGTAQDERRFRIDASGRAQVEVKVIDEESREPVAGLPVRAAASLYDWRRRNASQVTGEQGMAVLLLEALTQASTTYQITVPPTSLGGYLYQSSEAVNLSLPAGATDHDPIIVYVSRKTIQIDGQVTGADPSDKWRVWAIHLPDGISQSTPVSSDGTFSFRELPGGDYTIVAEPGPSADEGLWAEPAQVELIEESRASVTLEVKAGRTISGQVLDEEHQPIPFAWITSASGRTSWSDPVSGAYRLFGLDPRRVPVEVRAPGYYSQVQSADLSSGSIVEKNFILEIQTGTKILPWGEGRLVIPPETYYEDNGDSLTLSKGWLSGESTEDETLIIQVAGTQIEVRGGSFALEYLPRDGGWLQLTNGEGIVRSSDGREVLLEPGQMITLSESNVSSPMPYDPVVLAALRASRDPLIEPVWQPSPGARMQDGLARLGVSVVQVITFVTYMIVIVVLVGAIGTGLYWVWKRFIKG
jgi:WD40 repeat protein